MELEKDEKIAILLDDIATLESYILDLFTFSPLPISFISILGVVLEFNPAFERISGFKFYEVVGKGVERIFYKEEITKLISDTVENEEILGRELNLITKDRKITPVGVFTKVRRDDEGHAVGLFVGIFDLSEIKKKERDLEEKIVELEKFQKVAIGRELTMIKLKEDIRKLKEEA